MAATDHFLHWTALGASLAAHFERVGLPADGIVTAGDHPALAWRRSGLQHVTGPADSQGLVAPVALTTLADTALAAFRALSGADLPFPGALLLGERARLLGLSRQGAISPNGSCRLLAARDGTIALNLPRPGDFDLAGAMVEETVTDWAALARCLRRKNRAGLLERGRLLGLAIAQAAPPRPDPTPFRITAVHAATQRAGPSRSPLVVDFSALWAGPLAGSLLAAAGARVVKVESRTRPDGARGGHAGFYALLNEGKESVMFDFAAPADLARLRHLVAQADIVIEASRPRALRALGLVAEDHAARGATWLSITARGREGVQAESIGYGDDAGVAGGLAQRMAQGWGRPLFAGDAIADPLTGVLGALAAWASWLAGGGRLIDLAMADLAGFACHFGTKQPLRWQALAEADSAPLYPLRA